jgi:hypothetical protein
LFVLFMGSFGPRGLVLGLDRNFEGSAAGFLGGLTVCKNKQQQRQYFGRFALWASLLPSAERKALCGGFNAWASEGAEEGAFVWRWG